MKRLMVLTLACVFFSALLVVQSLAEMAKEGSGEYRSAKSTTSEFLSMEKERFQMNISQLGMVVDAPNNSPFENASFQALGTIHSHSGKYQGSGFVEWTCVNGDKIYGTFSSTGVLGKESSTLIELVGGTGSSAGIQGVLELGYGPSVKSAQKGIRQAYSVGTVSWKIP